MKKGFFYKNSLTLVFFLLFIISLVGQFFTGLSEYNSDLEEDKAPPVTISHYISSGHFISSTFENWESEFLQMGIYVLLTVWLRQKGSAESKKLEGEEDVDKEPEPKPDSPWPVRKGGIWLKLYNNSLVIAFTFLFLLSFSLHFKGSLIDYNDEQVARCRVALILFDTNHPFAG